LFLDSGASVIKKGRITRRARHVDKYWKAEYMV
jgi:hypothetical protein